MKPLERLLQDVTSTYQIEGGVLQLLDTFHLVFDTIPQGIFWKDTNCVYRGSNRHFAKIAGVADVKEVIGKTDYDFPWVEQAPLMQKYDLEIMESGQPRIAYEQPVKTASGTVIQTRVYKAPMLDREGKLLGIFGTYEDITEYTKMREELLSNAERKGAESQFRKLSRALEQSPCSVVITDRTGRIEYINKKFTNLSGYTLQEVLGKRPNVLKSGYHPHEFYADLWKRIRMGEEWVGTFCNRKKNGDFYWEAASISPLKDESGEITHFLSIKEDITEKKQAQESIQENEKKFRAIFEEARDAIILCSGTGFFDCNPYTLKMFGYTTKAQFLGLSPGDVSPPTQPDGRESESISQQMMAEVLNEGSRRFEWIHKRADGQLFPVDIQLSGIEWDGERAILAIIRDITERKKVEALLATQKQEIEKNYESLKHLETLRDNLMHMIVHDMRSPLTSISMALQLLKMSLPTEDQIATDTLRVAETSTKHLIEMATQLLDVSRLEAGQMPLNKSKLDITSLTQTVVSLFPVTTCERRVSALSSTPYLIDLDPDIVKRILTNLISNAVKFTPRNGEINVGITQIDSCVRLTVSDNGRGVPVESHQKIFEKFGQVGKENKKYGAGLGLHFCKLAVEAHGGKIGVESVPGQGSTFWFTLPV